MDFAKIENAYFDGHRRGTDLRPGELFIGAWGEARAASYDPHGVLGRVFTLGFLAAIKELFPHGIPTYLDGRIVARRGYTPAE